MKKEKCEMVGYMGGPIMNMTMRDHFAATALNGMLANPETTTRCVNENGQGEVLFSKVNFKRAYEMADEMLKAREGV